MLLGAARNSFDWNIVDHHHPAGALLLTSALANTDASHAENSLERPAMPAYARSHIVPPDEVGVYHCMARCVRRAFLCGVDPLTNHGSRQPSADPMHCGGPRCTQGQGLAPGQQRCRPGRSIAVRSLTERARPTAGQHALHRKATPRFPALVSVRNASWAAL